MNRSVVLMLVAVGCSEPQLSTPPSNLLVRDGEWIDFAGASVRRTSPTNLELWETGRLSSVVDFFGVEGECVSSPASLLLAPGQVTSVRIVCGVGGGTVEARSANRVALVTMEPRDGGAAGVDAGEDDGAVGGACSFTRLLFGDTFSFQRTEPGQSRSKEFAMLAESGDACVATITLNGAGFRLLSTTTFDADAGRSVALRPGEILRFGVEFGPSEFGIVYNASITIPQALLGVVGESSPFCPRVDAGCPSAAHAVYLSTTDSLFVLDGGGAQKIGDFVTVDGMRDGIKDIAIQADGRLFAVGAALYLVDPTTATMRSTRSFPPDYSALESGASSGQLLVGGASGVATLEANGQMTPIGMPMQVSGDIARLDSGIALVTVRESTGDALFSLNLNTNSWTRLCGLGVADVWGLTNSPEGLLGFTSNGEVLRIEHANCSVSRGPLQGTWTGAAWW